MESDKRLYLLGNEAIAYSSVEAGLEYASAYPGTPSTEILETLAKLSRKYNFYVEWSVNEKVAFEAAYGAAIAGVKSLVAMKHVGVNVAADPLTTSAYTGVNNSFVIVSADDPSMWSSQNEQDNRYYGLRSYIPVLEPPTPYHIKDVVIEAFKLSEKFRHPFILRSTTRLSHIRVSYEFNEPRRDIHRGPLDIDPARYSVIPAHARRLRVDMLARWSEIERYFNDAWFNWVEGDGDKLIITSGFSYSYVVDAISKLDIGDVKILSLSGMVPLPKKLVLEAVEDVDKVLIVEELEPIIETHIKSLLYDTDVRVEVVGKEIIPLVGELTLDKVLDAIAKWLELDIKSKDLNIDENLPVRPPAFCPGCPHRGTFFSLRKAVNRSGVKPIYSGDIGCYSLAVLPPFKMQDTIVDMGSSIGLANGFAHILPEEYIVVATIGDSTFFHSGITPLLNAVYNKSPILVVILDNRVTAMTGAQPNPGSGYDAGWEETIKIDIKKVVEGLGIEYIAEVDPFKIRESEKIFRDAVEYVRRYRRPAVVIAKRACTLLIAAWARRRGIEIPKYDVDVDKCIKCGICYNNFTCPAIYPDDEGIAHIDPALCVGCGECLDICPTKAFKPVSEWSDEFKSLWW